MDKKIDDALSYGGLIDITTTGRKSGRAHRIEIGFHNLDGVLYITGRPGTRDWVANLAADPRFTFHLKNGTKADLQAEARPVTDLALKEAVLRRIMIERWNSPPDRVEAALPRWVDTAPLVVVTIDEKN